MRIADILRSKGSLVATVTETTTVTGLLAELATHNIGDTIRMSEIKLPNGVRPSVERDFVIATLKASASAVSEGAEGETAEA